MKAIQAILIFSLNLLLFSCDNEENDSPNFSSEYLKQTQWTGRLDESFIFDGQLISRTYNVGVIFYTDSTGKSSVEAYESNFNYSTNEKLLKITNGDSDMNGQWLLLQFDDNRMVLEKGTGGKDAYKGILTLTRSH